MIYFAVIGKFLLLLYVFFIPRGEAEEHNNLQLTPDESKRPRNETSAGLNAPTLDTVGSNQLGVLVYKKAK